MEVIDTEIEDLEELIVLSKDNTTELNELKNQLSEVEQKIKDLEEESLYSEAVSYTHLTLPTSYAV